MKKHDKPPKRAGELIPKGVAGGVLRAEKLAHPTPRPPRSAQIPRVSSILKDGGGGLKNKIRAADSYISSPPHVI